MPFALSPALAPAGVVSAASTCFPATTYYSSATIRSTTGKFFYSKNQGCFGFAQQ
jgi:hypothetical protein